MRLNGIKSYNWVAGFLICVATIVTVRLAIECTKLSELMDFIILQCFTGPSKFCCP